MKPITFVFSESVRTLASAFPLGRFICSHWLVEATCHGSCKIAESCAHPWGMQMKRLIVAVTTLLASTIVAAPASAPHDDMYEREYGKVRYGIECHAGRPREDRTVRGDRGV